MGIKGALAGQQAGLGGDAKSSMLWSFFIRRTGLLISFLNFALLFLNQICKTNMTMAAISLTEIT